MASVHQVWSRAKPTEIGDIIVSTQSEYERQQLCKISVNDELFLIDALETDPDKRIPLYRVAAINPLSDGVYMRLVALNNP